MNSSLGQVEARLVGIVVLPSIGQYLSDRAGLGRGAYLVVVQTLAKGLATFVGVRVAQGADARRTIADVRPDVLAWAGFSPPFVYTEPVRPPEIVNAESMRTGPIRSRDC